jgi:hypothetical protein
MQRGKTRTLGAMMVGFGGAPRDPEQRKIRPSIAIAVLLLFIIVVAVLIWK